MANLPEKKSAGKVIGQKVSLNYAWYALFVLFLVNFFNYVDRMSINTAMETLKRYFEINDTKLGLIASAFTLVYAVISLPMGFLSDRGVRTRIIAAGIFVWSFATYISGFMTKFVPFFLARAAVGSGEGIFAPSGNAIIADYFPKRLRNTAISIFMSAMMVGGAAAFIVAGLILQRTQRFDMKRVEPLAVSRSYEAIPGWTYTRSYETKQRDAAFEFKNAAGESFSVALKKHEEKKPGKKKKKGGPEIVASSLLFDVYGMKNEGSAGAAPGAAERALIAAVADRVAKHEADPIKESRFDLAAMPAGFKPPEKFAGRLSYDEVNKQLVFSGIMTNEDKKELQALTEDDKFQKGLQSIHSDTNFFYIRSDNWKWIFWILGPPGLLIALLCFFLKEPLKGGGEDFLSEDEARSADQSGKADFMLLFRTPSVIIMMLSNVLVTYCTGGLVIWLFPFVERYKGIESSVASMSFGPVVIASCVLGVIISGIIADKLAKKTHYGNNIILVLSLLLATPFLYGFLMARTEQMLLVNISLCMFFLSGINGPQNALLMSLVEPKLRATLNAVHILLIHLLGDALSPVVIGYMSDRKGLMFALMITPIFLVLGMIGFGIAAKFVPADLKAMEDRMKGAAA